MTVWILFGDTARCDGENIEGVYKTKDAAEEALDRILSWRSEYGAERTDFSIEEFDVEG